MNRDGALDELAFRIGLRLMGADARRTLRLALYRELGDIPVARGGPPPVNRDFLEHEDALIRGELEPTSYQDSITLERARERREAPPFDEGFWSARAADLRNAGFTREEAAAVVEAVQCQLTNHIHGTIGEDSHGDIQTVGA